MPFQRHPVGTPASVPLALLLAAPALLPFAALAADFDGSKNLLCASQQVMDVNGGREVVSGLPDELGAPSFMRINFKDKTITGDTRATPIRVLERNGERLLLQGVELGLGWTLALATSSGKMSGSLVDEDGAVVIFGSCTPL